MLTSTDTSRKLVIIGDGACGKTSLLSVFTLGYFPTVSLAHLLRDRELELTSHSTMLVTLPNRPNRPTNLTCFLGPDSI